MSFSDHYQLCATCCDGVFLDTNAVTPMSKYGYHVWYHEISDPCTQMGHINSVKPKM
jgi:hypothetical protein